jgi:hypothetical protein
MPERQRSNGQATSFMMTRLFSLEQNTTIISFGRKMGLRTTFAHIRCALLTDVPFPFLFPKEMVVLFFLQ